MGFDRPLFGEDRTGLSTTDNKLYYFGYNIQYKGRLVTDVHEYNGRDWQPVGELRYTQVYDVEWYRGNLYCATSDGLYILNEE